MTDRLKGLVVTLKPDFREDDARKVIDAIKLLHGVIDARPMVADMDHYFAVATARSELINKLWEVLK